MLKNFSTYCFASNLKEIREFVRKALTPVSLSSVEKEHLVLAVDEICTNVMEHSHPDEPEARIDINVAVDQGQTLIKVIDFDPKSFDLESYKLPSLAELKEEGKDGGMGLRLVMVFVDKLSVLKEGQTLVWTLQKNLKQLR